jgi:hypothetical protein
MVHYAIFFSQSICKEGEARGRCKKFSKVNLILIVGSGHPAKNSPVLAMETSPEHPKFATVDHPPPPMYLPTLARNPNMTEIFNMVESPGCGWREMFILWKAGWPWTVGFTYTVDLFICSSTIPSLILYTAMHMPTL